MSITFDFAITNYSSSLIPKFVCAKGYLKNLYPSSDIRFRGNGETYAVSTIKQLTPAGYFDVQSFSNREQKLVQSIPVQVNGVNMYLKYFLTNYSGYLALDVYWSDNPTNTSGYIGGRTAPSDARYVQVRNVAEYLRNSEGEVIWQAIGSAFSWSNDPIILPYNYSLSDMYICGILCQNLANFDAYAEETSSEVGEPSGEGGYTGGTFDDSSDTISLPPTPTMGVTSVGFINVYAPTQGQLQQFGSELFPDLSFTPVSQSGTPSSVTDALVAMAQVLVDFGNQIPQMIDMYINSNLINYVIDCHVIPVSPQVSGSAPVKVGFKTFTPTPSVVTSDYVDFDCGTINVGEYYANFIDYLPYTRAKLYLPFVGFIDLAPEYWQSGSLNVTYRFNIIDGSFVAFVKSTSSKSKLSDSVIGQFGGNACIHIPITGLNYASMVSGIVGAMSPLLPSATGGVGDALVNSANAIANNKPNLQQSNGYNATTSFLTVRYPYLLIERSVSNFSRKYAEEDGIPSNITLDFSSLTGLTKATMLHLDGISGATEDDLDEIASLLSEGVIL